ncbi:MAG: hypothetical protein WA639_24840 [Candidatus Acidiferrum sp.]
MQSIFLSLLFLSVFRFFAPSLQYWTQTETETIWHEKYKNCDMGYSVILPKGVIAHDDLPPNPNHGFLVSAGDPDTRAEVSLEAQRLVGVYDFYDAMDYGSARAYLKAELKRAGPVEILETRDARLRGLPAVQIHYRKGVGDSAVETEEMIVFRGHPRNSSPTFYVIWPRTPSAHYEEDDKLYHLICDGFNIIPVPHGECSND